MQKKRAGTKVLELETKLGKVQGELKKLREQLVSAEAAKKDAQVALEEAKKHVGTTKGSPKTAASLPPPSPTRVALENEEKITDVDLSFYSTVKPLGIPSEFNEFLFIGNLPFHY